MRNCPQCGAQVGDSMRFCTNCGRMLDPQPYQPQSYQAQPYQSQPYYQPQPYQPQGGGYSASSREQLKTDRNPLLFILLSIITLGIYGLVAMAKIGKDLNTIASPYDGKNTFSYWLVVLLTILTTFVSMPVIGGILGIVWSHMLCDRIGQELRRRGIDYAFGAGTYWGWNILGALIIVGPIVFLCKLLTAMNALSEDYNLRG